MGNITRKWEGLPSEKKKAYVDELIYFFQKERGEEIGFMAAQQILDFFLVNAANEVYKMGVNDAKSTIQNRMEDLNLDLDMLLD